MNVRPGSYNGTSGSNVVRRRPEFANRIAPLCFEDLVLRLQRMPIIDPTAKQSPFTHFYHYEPFHKKYLTDMTYESSNDHP